MAVLRAVPAALCVGLLAACPVPSSAASAKTAPVEWPVHGGNDAEQQWSPLEQVNTGTVDKLGLAWSFEFDSSRGQEATPIVSGGVMYVSTAWSHVVALEASSGRELWRFDPHVAGHEGFEACCDVVSRGVAVSAGRVYLAALDGRLIALDAKSGRMLWSVQTTDPSQPFTITGAPRVMGDKIIIGNAGAEYGVRGYVTAYAAATGRQVWRFYTVPASPTAPPDGAASDPILKQTALPTWAGRWYEHGGGGTVWDGIAYDPQLHRVYIGVGNGTPWDHKVRSLGQGDNLFLASIVALDADTGAYRWHYQENPGESWDFDATQPMILAALKLDGRDRKVLMQASKNGFFYVIDRESGKLLSAQNFVSVNWASGVDLKTGRPVENPAARYAEKPFVMQPSGVGGHSWHPMAFDPRSHLVYLPTHQFVMVYGKDPAFTFRVGNWNTALDPALQVPPDDPVVLKNALSGFQGRLVAWDPVAQKEVWSVAHPSLQNGGVLATAGGLVFEGTGAGTFEARRADDGSPLWSFKAQDGIMAAPVSYSVDGEQYVAVASGYGGGFGLGIGTYVPVRRPNGRLLAFRLGGAATLPDVPHELAPLVQPTERFTDDQVNEGRLLYAQQCYRCHGAGAQSGGVLPDLRRSAALSDRAAWSAIVHDGALESKGMIGFKAWLNPQQIDSIRAFVALKAKIAADQPKADTTATNH